MTDANKFPSFFFFLPILSFFRRFISGTPERGRNKARMSNHFSSHFLPDGFEDAGSTLGPHSLVLLFFCSSDLFFLRTRIHAFSIQGPFYSLPGGKFLACAASISTIPTPFPSPFTHRPIVGAFSILKGSGAVVRV